MTGYRRTVPASAGVAPLSTRKPLCDGCSTADDPVVADGGTLPSPRFRGMEMNYCVPCFQQRRPHLFPTERSIITWCGEVIRHDDDHSRVYSDSLPDNICPDCVREAGLIHLLRGTPHPNGEDWLTQVLNKSGEWEDYCRSTEAQTRDWFRMGPPAREPGQWRCVDWIKKDVILIPATEVQ